MIEEETLKDLATEYGIGIETIKEFCDTLLTYPCVLNGDDEYLYECLEILVSERSNLSLSDNASSKNNLLKSVEKCVYRIYGEDSIPYLSDSFKEENGLDLEENDDEEMS